MAKASATMASIEMAAASENESGASSPIIS